MKLVEEKAIRSFKSGLNCAQAVVAGYSDELNFDDNLALNMSCGFGGGMGRLQETCGAVTGSYMILGIFNGRKYESNKEKKEVTYSMVQKFSEKFKSIYGTTDCRELLNCDLKTEEGHKFAKDNNLFEVRCEKCISDAIKILDELIVK
jgi:C_GCAxxG_C_C family probable redox protein